ncbi:MAG: RraA family protein [Lautropia sp.]
MIDAPALLAVRRRFARPAASAIAALRAVPLGVLADAQRGRGGLDHRIRPVFEAAGCCGPAITCWCGPGDNLAALAALELARAGDVIVIGCDGFEGAGVIGDRFAGMARNKGIAGIVVDGLVRDRAGIRDAAVPCYARGVTATSAYSSGPGEVGLPIAIGHVVIEAGDLIAGDGDGLLVVPRRRIAAVRSALPAVLKSEAKLDRIVADGATGFEHVRALLGSPAARDVD